MYGSLDISTSGMMAQKTRLDVASANLANSDAILDSSGRVNPYRTRRAMIATGNPEAKALGAQEFGVHVARIQADTAPPELGEYDPNSPLAYTEGPYKGYVAKPGVDVIAESVNAMEAVRAYEANVMAAEATKQLFNASLRLIA
ncbi:flagellar basal body rod protein FlgC [soil metagenome]